MPCLKLRHPSLPPSLAGWILTDQHGRPRYWPTIWLEMAHARASSRTQQVHLGALDRLYASAEAQLGTGRLDNILAAGDLDALEDVLAGFLGKLRNDGLISRADRSGAWRTALRFVGDILRLRRSSSVAEMSELEAGLRRLERMYGQLSPTPPSTRAPLRALPALVIEDLWEQLDPTSPRNPFRSAPLRWRNLLIFLLLLHLGLRRGEVGLLPANAIKDEFDPSTGAGRYWINVEPSPDFDPRYEAPGLKTETARRQLPVSREVLKVHEIYVQNYRAKGRHPFLITSQQARPLSLRAFGYVFETITTNLTSPARRALENRRLNSVSAHDLRHTAAVLRLHRYVEAGNDLPTAIEKLRVFFGWAHGSEMPRLYARAYFEPTLADVWHDSFDRFVDTLRQVEGGGFP